MGGGGRKQEKGGGGQVKFFSLKKGGGRKSFISAIFQFCSPTPHPAINEQSLMIVHFEVLILLSPSEIRRELCKLLILISQGID